ncbi:MAG: undecaprenyl-phosphate glucose phosphotransferase [Planctomycetes bacterium]|nr:undecaprenyl-phosphate glucose phosphotransferase [Planctomycetota bacterium]
MLKRHHQVFSSLLIAGDLVLVALSWGLLLWLERWDAVSAPFRIRLQLGLPRAHLQALLAVLPLYHLVYRATGLYLPRRFRSLGADLFDVVRASAVSFGASVFACFFLYRIGSRTAYATFFCGSLLSTVSFHLLARAVLQRLRERGWNLRHVLVVGCGASARAAVERLARNPWMGLSVAGVVEDAALEPPPGTPRLGGIHDLHEVIARHGIDQVIVALPMERHADVARVLDALTRETVDVRIVPDLTSFLTLNCSVGELDGLPMLNLRESPLYGWNRVAKRVLDILLSLLILVLFAVPMLLIAAAIKMTSRGPLFYTQERLGLDGRVFRMLKFRTMVPDAERSTGAVWARQDDPRRTRLGSFLRATSLDELPQFFNVLKGEMSIVGPRPERPEFIGDFTRKIPAYMLRHKMKAGITGWAQINGWRGNTSLEKRIEYDLYYIEHWSVWFDLRIIALTPFKGLVNRNAY